MLTAMSLSNPALAVVVSLAAALPASANVSPIPFSLLPDVPASISDPIAECFSRITVPAVVTDGQVLSYPNGAKITTPRCSATARQVRRLDDTRLAGFRFQGEYHAPVDGTDWAFLYPEQMVPAEEFRQMFLLVVAQGARKEFRTTGLLSGPLTLNGQVIASRLDVLSAHETTTYQGDRNGDLRAVGPMAHRIQATLDSVRDARDAMRAGVDGVDARFLAAQPQPRP